MLFRRQDIPKTTRTPKGGGTRRVYPRFIRDKRQLPKIDLAIEYLSGMVGQRRADLSQQTVLEFLGDPKLARCLLACLGDYFHYVTPTFEEVVGPARAKDLLKWNFEAPTDLRAFVYRLANDRRGGFVTLDQHRTFLAKTAQPLGLDAETLFQLLHLDAERNAIFQQRGDQPNSADLVASYNTRLVLSTLRQAARVKLDLNGISRFEIESCCARHDVQFCSLGDSAIELIGSRDSHGSFSRHGRKLARCVHQLVLAAESVNAVDAIVYLNDRPLHFELDDRSIAFLKPKSFVGSTAASLERANDFLEKLAAYRSESGNGREWKFRRLPDCKVVEHDLVLPELTAVRDCVSVDLVFSSSQELNQKASSCVQEIKVRFLMLLISGESSEAAISDDPAEVLAMLDKMYAEQISIPELSTLIDGMLRTRPYVSAAELMTLCGSNGRHQTALYNTDRIVFLPELGLFDRAKLIEVEAMVNGGTPQISILRAAVAERFGEEVADALTIRLLSNHQVIAAAA